MKLSDVKVGMKVAVYRAGKRTQGTIHSFSEDGGIIVKGIGTICTVWTENLRLLKPATKRREFWIWIKPGHSHALFENCKNAIDYRIAHQGTVIRVREVKEKKPCPK